MSDRLCSSKEVGTIELSVNSWYAAHARSNSGLSDASDSDIEDAMSTEETVRDLVAPGISDSFDSLGAPLGQHGCDVEVLRAANTDDGGIATGMGVITTSRIWQHQ